MSERVAKVVFQRAQPGGPWLLGTGRTKTPIQAVHDDELGTLLFPGHDKVMAEWIAEHGVWEPEEHEWMARTLAPGDTFLNVGANVGYHVLLGSKLVGPEGRVFAIEPDPVNFQFLLANLAIHDVRNATAIQCAAGSTRGSMTLYRSSYNAGDNRLTPFEEATSAVKVQVRRLDDLLAGVVVDGVVVDTQGWDHEVVAGMGRLLDGLPPMMVEFVSPWLRERGLDPGVVVAGFQRLGYAVGVPQTGLALGASAAAVVSAADNEPWGIANLELKASSY